MRTALWIGVATYVAAAWILGWLASRRQDEGSAYWTAGRGLGSASVGLSISAGFLSVSWSCVYAIQLFYWYGLGGLWLITLPWLLTLAGIHYLAGRYRELPSFSQPEMVGERFGEGARRAVAVALALVFLIWGGAEIYVAARLLAPPLGVSPRVAIVGISVVVGIYATLGGFRAVVSTDKMQYAIVALYVLAMGWLAMRGLAQETGSLLPEVSTTASKTGRRWTSLVGPGIATALISLVAYLPGWLFETDLWLRVQAARDAKTARRGMWIAGINAFFFVGVLPLYIGIAALELFPHDSGVAPTLLGQDGDAILVALVERFSPGWLAVLVAMGLVAAAMSTIDTCANVTALSLGYDLLGVHEKPGAIAASRWVTAGVMAAACGFALFTESLWDLFYLSGGVLTTAVAWPVAAVLTTRVSRLGVTFSSIVGFSCTVASYYLESRGYLGAVEPAWMVESGLGFILWGVLGAIVGHGVGSLVDRKSSRVG